MAEDRKFDRMARESLKAMLNIDAMRIDWANPDADALRSLREMTRECDAAELAEAAGVPMAEAEEVLLGSDDSPAFIRERGEAIRELGRFLANDPMFGTDALSVDLKHVVSVSLALNGPTATLDFELDRDGNLLGAEASYLDGGRKATLELFEEEAETLWERFSQSPEALSLKPDRPRPVFGDMFSHLRAGGR